MVLRPTRENRISRPVSRRGLFQTFQQAVAANHLLKRGEKIVVGVSGGADSVALLHLLCATGHSPIAAHFNHVLRAAESDRDEKFVHDLCRRWNLRFEGARADTRADARLAGESIEEAARRLRYNFFAQVAADSRASKVFVAHNQNDQAETLLLRLLRGAGRRGLGGMRMTAPLPVEGSRVLLIRPLLRSPRSEILTYLSENRLPFRNDTSNRSGEFLRNRVRLKLLPLIQKEFQPAIVDVLARTAEMLAEEDRLLERKLPKPRRGSRLNRKKLLKLSEGLRRRALAGWLEAQGCPQVSWERTEAVLRAAVDTAGGRRSIQLSGGRSVRVENGALLFEQN